MRRVRSVGAHLGTLGELLSLLWQRKLWWLIPMVLMLLVFAVLIVLAQASSVAPFLYPVL